jgi:hypothetical protein
LKVKIPPSVVEAQHELVAGPVFGRKRSGYEVEFMTLAGENLAVVSLFPNQVRAVGRREIAQARSFEAA